MSMKSVKLTELSEAVRSFLREAFEGGGVVIEDDSGSSHGGVFPYTRASAEEQAESWGRLQALQKRVGDRLRKQGKTEEELDRILQEDE